MNDSILSFALEIKITERLKELRLQVKDEDNHGPMTLLLAGEISGLKWLMNELQEFNKCEQKEEE